MRIVYVGPLDIGGTCRMRMNALRRLGHEVVPVDTLPPGEVGAMRDILQRVARRFHMPLDMAGANRRMLESLNRDRIEMLWIDKGLLIGPETLAKARRMMPDVIIVGYSPDDMANPANQSFRFLRSAGLYDLFVTTKTYNVQELGAMGFSNVMYVQNAYEPEVHRPMLLETGDRDTYGGEVGFIGAWEEDRARQMRDLARAGVSVRVWGHGWRSRMRTTHPLLRIESRGLSGEDYARALCAFDINLGFLRKVNRDQQTTRSIEIPACGAFLLAERTEEHLGLFKEGVEAEFFGSTEELIDKCRYYLAHPAERAVIALAGRERCVRGGYSNDEVLRPVLAAAQALRDRNNAAPRVGQLPSS